MFDLGELGFNWQSQLISKTKMADLALLYSLSTLRLFYLLREVMTFVTLWSWIINVDLLYEASIMYNVYSSFMIVVLAALEVS